MPLSAHWLTGIWTALYMHATHDPLGHKGCKEPAQRMHAGVVTAVMHGRTRRSIFLISAEQGASALRCWGDAAIAHAACQRYARNTMAPCGSLRLVCYNIPLRACSRVDPCSVTYAVFVPYCLRYVGTHRVFETSPRQ
jgi:hypothetical protein